MLYAIIDSVMAINPATIVKGARTRARLTQRELAARAGTAQSVVARIELGQSSPSLETLSRLLTAAGYAIEANLVATTPDDPVIDAYKRDIDRTLLRRNLEKSPEERVKSLQSFARFADEVRRAGIKARARAE